MSGLYNTTLPILAINGTNIELNGGVRTAADPSGGGISISPGDGVGSAVGNGGACTILGGPGDGSGSGGLISISGGTSGTDLFADGGILILSGGNSVGTGGVGGDINIITGSGSTKGKLNFFIGDETTGAIKYIWPTVSPTAGQTLTTSSVVGTNPIVSTMGWNRPGYAYARLSAVTLTPIKDLIWNTSVVTSSISLNTGTGVFTLTGGKTYLLTTNLIFYGVNSDGDFGFCWVDTSNNVLPNFQRTRVFTVGLNNATQTAICTGIYTPSVTGGVKVRIILAGNQGNQTIRDEGSAAVITEL
jgi:hypothetical protein